MIRKIGLVLAFIFTTGAPAQEPQTAVYTFQAWKEQQILEAQNQSLRISARIAQLKSGKPSTTKSPTNIPANAKIKKSDLDTVSVAEKELRRAQEGLKAANDYSIEDYVSVYLPSLRDNPEAIEALSQKMSKEELAQVFKALFRKEAPSDTKRNNLAGSLSASSH